MTNTYRHSLAAAHDKEKYSKGWKQTWNDLFVEDDRLGFFLKWFPFKTHENLPLIEIQQEYLMSHGGGGWFKNMTTLTELKKEKKK